MPFYFSSSHMSARQKIDVFPHSEYALTQHRSCRKHADQSPAAKLQRMKLRFDNLGTIRSVEAVCLVHSHNHPHVLLLEMTVGQTSVFRLPGGKCLSDEEDTVCLQRKLRKKLFGGVGGRQGGDKTAALASSNAADDTETISGIRVGEVLSTWVRPNFDPLMYPYRPVHITKEKEVRTVFLVHLDASLTFSVPSDYRLVTVPLFEIFDNAPKYGNVIAGIPHTLSRLHMNLC